MTLTPKAQVRGGRLVLDEAIDLPEGSVVELPPLDMGDSLDDEDRLRLNAALERAATQLEAGSVIPAAAAFSRLGIRDEE